MTDTEYLYCESRYDELYHEKMALYKKLNAVCDEMNRLNTTVFNNPKPVCEIKFPYKEFSS